jgi:hypothetical protein
VSLRDGLALAQATGRLRVIDPSPGLDQPYTLWGGLIGGFFLMLAYFGCDQSQVQRYLSGSSLTQSRLSLLFNAFLKVPMQFMILLTGVLVFVFYHFHAPQLLWNPTEMKRLQERTAPDEMSALEARFRDAQAARRAAAEEFLRQRGTEAREAAAREYLEAEGALQAGRSEAVRRVEAMSGGKRYNDTNYIFPTYILTHLPRAWWSRDRGDLRRAMSTLSGELSSLATATVVDFYKRFVRPDGGDAHELLVSRVLTGFWGCFASLVALQAGRLGSAIEVVNRFGSYFYGSILGVFALAVLTPRASARGAFYGLFAGMAAVALVSLTTLHFLWYNVVGALTVFAVGLHPPPRVRHLGARLWAVRRTIP